MKVQDSIDLLFEKTPADYVCLEAETPEYFQFYVNCGGDICNYRVYKKTGVITIK